MEERPYPFSDFPLIGPKRFFSIRKSYLDMPLLFENDDSAYYSKIHNDSREFDTDVAERDVFRTSIEIIPGKLLKSHSFNIKNMVMNKLN